MSTRTDRKAVTAGLLAALFVGALDATVVSTAMPRIEQELGGLSLMSWVFSVYTLTTCLATPIFGKLADLFGRKIVFAIGLVLFAVGSVLCGAAGSMVALILFRAVQGIGAGALNPVTFTIIGDLYPGEERGRMQGLFASVWSVAGLLGPLVGGYFVDQVSWRWIFFVNVPVGVVSFLLVCGFLHERFEKKRNAVDYAGAVTLTVGLTALLFALLSGGETYAWNSPQLVLLFAVTAAAGMLFVRIERKAPEPLIPLSLFRSRVMNICNALGFLGFCISTGVTIYAPLWIQSLMDKSATVSGLIVMPMSIFWPIASNLAGRLMYRLGSKTIVTTGSIVLIAGTAWLLALRLDSPTVYWTGILSVIGFGMGCLTTPATVLIQSAVGWGLRGVATSTNALMRTLGQTVGVAVFGTLFNSFLVTHAKPELARGMHAVFIVLFAIAAATLIVVAMLPAHRRIMEQQAQET
jgi:EmrB/QacA subfamily drug resistance transporter